MDQEVARTLDELERKIGELERTLGAMGSGEERLLAAGDGAGAIASAGRAATQQDAAEEGPHAQAVPAGRIIDESLEARGTGAHPQPAPGAAAGVPSAEALLRFRRRLERSAAELTHEYDELLGRLSYAAVSAPPPPTISFARGAPSLDIIDVQGLRDAAARAFDSDPGGATAYGTAIGYPRLRSWIAERHGVESECVIVTNGSMQADAANLRPHAALAARTRRPHPRHRAGARRHRRRRARTAARGRRAPGARAHHPQLSEPRGLHALAGEARATARAGRAL
jgi:hypothetical protein